LAVTQPDLALMDLCGVFFNTLHANGPVSSGLKKVLIFISTWES